MKLSLIAILFSCGAYAAEFHVAPAGNDAGPGTKSKPFKTISAAANVAQPGDVITVHEGVYREHVNPLHGGTSDKNRITYQAAPCEKVVITGSEPIKGWEKVTNDTWKVTLPHRFFGSFNPYSDVIHGSWYDGRGRLHRTGCVYQEGNWLMEAAQLDDVLKPANPTIPSAILLNVAWIRPANSTKRIAADQFTDRSGTHTWPCSEGGQCIGSVENGHWVRYQRVDFGDRTESVEIRAASATDGGTIELRDGAPDGALLGSCVVTGTGGWQAWDSFQAQIKPSSGVKTLCLLFKSNQRTPSLWYGRVDKENTVIHAQFPGIKPNEANIEINVRQTVFYPEKPLINYITVRGFILENAAPNWAPPNAEQKAIIGTHWSKGWIIENNTVRYSRCAGMSLGKYGDEWDNKSDTAQGFVETVKRALKNGWNKETVGSHIVRNNHIHHCEQAGIVGSMGCAFSTVTGNEIHDIYVHRQYAGAETAGIKFHGAIDMTISNNHIYRCGIFGGLWLDWMAQGTQVTGNLFHDNNGSNLGAEYTNQDILLEVNHGPLLFANNLLLSQRSLWAISQGCAYVHNLFAGSFRLNRPGEESRVTPAQKAHSTEMTGLHHNPVGDVRFLNNLFAPHSDASPYDKPTLPVTMAGNVFLKGAKPSKQEAAPLLKPDFDPAIKLVEKPDGWYLDLTLDKVWRTEQPRKPITSTMLGKATIPNQPFENPDGTPIRVDADYFGKRRDTANPFPGPFEISNGGTQALKVWPKP